MALKSKRLEDVRPTVPVAEVQRVDMVRVNLNIPDAQRRRWKAAAAAQGVPLAQLIVAAVEGLLGEK